MKKINPNKRIIFSIITGTLFLLGIYYFDRLYNEFWIFAGLILLPIIILQILLIFLNIKRNKIALSFTIITFLLGLIILVYKDTELFKSKILMKAVLVDDLSSLELKLRNNNTFELVSTSYLGSSEKFTGKYTIDNNKIIFNNRPYDNDFIPDTVYIIKNKIIIKFNTAGEPDTSFANYFRIDKNELKKNVP
ncbi:hypothetical protein LA303_07880 [Candidatus Sulfidibacterium hydrothermale]|uniref:hypothetical protein n=1 Tax=Candidatus Sulfidibacterium hydrothermale TaxID=2875962 RepID=UPI001F0A8812|nr:hypothetical protein [Candidatus Sulfidibacterium hydrothermale]UBM61342.1 hypothetical protein LA303_07880 [Candidatus Sulfidibacterium hydrothermale]